MTERNASMPSDGLSQDLGALEWCPDLTAYRVPTLVGSFSLLTKNPTKVGTLNTAYQSRVPPGVLGSLHNRKRSDGKRTYPFHFHRHREEFEARYRTACGSKRVIGQTLYQRR